MPRSQLSVNRIAQSLAERLCNKADEYGVIVRRTQLGTTVIDAGIEAKGGFLAGRIITEICLGGCGRADIFPAHLNDSEFLSISVYTDHPALATLGSQFAGWQIKVKDYFAIGSGPARALALKPREIYEKIGYEDEADVAVLVLETGKEPPSDVVSYICGECRVEPDHLSLILVPTTSICGSVQVSGRVVETGIHKLTKLGFDPKSIMYAWGCAPIAPVHLRFAEAMGRANDAILYGGIAYCTVEYDDEEELKRVVEKTPSKASKDYGRPFIEIFKEADHNFYKIDPNLFAPAVLVVNNAKTGRVFRAGEINSKILKKSLGL